MFTSIVKRGLVRLHEDLIRGGLMMVEKWERHELQKIATLRQEWAIHLSEMKAHLGAVDNALSILGGMQLTTANAAHKNKAQAALALLGLEIDRLREVGDQWDKSADFAGYQATDMHRSSEGAEVALRILNELGGNISKVEPTDAADAPNEVVLRNHVLTTARLMLQELVKHQLSRSA
jgi:hypothetical protein